MMFLKKLMTAILLDAVIAVSLAYVYVYHVSDYGIKLKVHQLYRDILVQTGQTQDALPLIIEDIDEDNAYIDGKKIVIYSGLINKHSWDSIALVLGHEVAHGMLAHLNKQPPIPEQIIHTGMSDNDFSAVLEANADKLGAVYMMKAGYDICEGRKIFLEWKAESGNYLGMSHPDYDYRYAELNINCGGN